jgi:hypothetical protein
MKQTILTFIAKVDPGRVAELRDLLREIATASDFPQNPYIPFPSLKRLHFASLVLHEDADYGSTFVFENNFDGPLDAHLQDLYENAAEGLHRMYGCCIDYPATSAPDRQQLISYLRAHLVRPNAFHIGNVGRGLERTKQEDKLRDELENFLDGLAKRRWPGQTPGSIRSRVQEFIRNHEMAAWASRAEPRQTAMERFLPWLKIGIAALVAILLLPLLIPFLIVWFIVLRYKEKRDIVPPDSRSSSPALSVE